jgi:hypothetical protein
VAKKIGRITVVEIGEIGKVGKIGKLCGVQGMKSFVQLELYLVHFFDLFQ